MLIFYAFRLLLLVLLGISNYAASEVEESQTYIIHVDHTYKNTPFLNHDSWYKSMLESLPSSLVDGKEMLLYSYNHAMHGFSARLTPSQLSHIENHPAHLATYPESFGELLTTHSPKFLGLKSSSGIWPAASFGKDVIIGIIDSGIWPESESFSDKGMSQVPQRWKGKCENGTAFSSSACNKKLIGAQSFSKGVRAAGLKISKKLDYDSPRDYRGHGTHVASIAAGNYVPGVSCFGYGRGTARGMAPGAHVSMYKVFLALVNSIEVAATDILAAMDQAIADGVDIMSLSLRLEQAPYFDDIIAIASLSAIERGIHVVCAAGNNGTRNSIYNGAPWITTVGAGTQDRSFTATLSLNNGTRIEGISYFPESVYITDVPLYYEKRSMGKRVCNSSALDHKQVVGKVVLCDHSNHVDISTQLREVERAGAYAGIFVTDLTFIDTIHTIPSIVLTKTKGIVVKEYAARVRTDAKIRSIRTGLTRLGTKPAPQIAYFSSRGPDSINPGILKPDIIAPGSEVIAGFVPNRAAIKIKGYDLVTDYALDSGTSMAAPHVSGMAALLKAAHPDWSPAAIRSAIMTTAYVIDNTKTTLKDQMTGLPATPLDFGAGHINPNKALEPGLVYDIDYQDYIQFLCGLGYNDKQMRAVTRHNQSSCKQEAKDLNYPSFIATFSNTMNSSMTKSFSRVVTNVEDGKSIYRAVLEASAGIRIEVEPSTLTFNQKHEKKGFTLRLEIDKGAPEVSYGYLKWIDQHNHVVSSPVVAMNS